MSPLPPVPALSAHAGPTFDAAAAGVSEVATGSAGTAGAGASCATIPPISRPWPRSRPPIARAVGVTGLTNTGATIGTWAYVARAVPKQHRRPRCHLRAGVCAACVVDRAGPDSYGQPSADRGAHVMRPPPLPSVECPGVPAALDEVIATGMARDPTGAGLALGAYRPIAPPRVDPRPDVAGSGADTPGRRPPEAQLSDAPTRVMVFRAQRPISLDTMNSIVRQRI